MQALRALGDRVAPTGSRRRALLRAGAGGARAAIRRAAAVPSRLRSRARLVARRLGAPAVPETLVVQPASPPPPLQRHRASVDVVVCVHNAPDDVRRCLESLIRTTHPPYRLILVDDGSDPPTAGYLLSFSTAQGAVLVRNQSARGYTRAANQGLAAATAEFVVLLNSDTVLTDRWLDRLVACAESAPEIAIVGPLSNTASWQSVPEVFGPDADWSRNPLPEGFDADDMAAALAASSTRLHPRIPFLNGFCLLLRRSLLRGVGGLDETSFPYGYGEENDLCLRARAAGFALAVADDAYVYHAQSRSYSDERRRQLVAATDRALIEKHGASVISRGVEACRDDLVLAGARSRLAAALQRAALSARVGRQWEARRILFSLQAVTDQRLLERALQLAQEMLAMGIDARLALSTSARARLEPVLPRFEVPIAWADREPTFDRSRFDAVLSSDALAAAGPAVDPLLFRPRPRGASRRRVRLAARLRHPEPEATRTAALLGALCETAGRRDDVVEIVLFDGADDGPPLQPSAARFEWRRTAPLSLLQRAAFMSTVDVLVEVHPDQLGAETALEAMASGAAVVVGADLPDLEPLRDGVNAVIVPPGDAGPLAAALERLVDDPALRGALQQRAVADIAPAATWGAAARLLDAALRATPGGRP